MVLGNRAVKHKVTAFSELSFAVHWQGRLSRGYCNTTIKLSTTAAMVDNLPEKVDECPTKGS